MKSPVSIALLAAGFAACHSVDMYPVGTGTGGTGGSMMPDAAQADSLGSGSTIHGRVCLISDARSPLSCATSGADNLTVTLGSAMAMTSADGSFTITTASATNLVWRVSGANIQAAAMPVSTVATIPALSTALYEDMASNNQAAFGDGTGAVIARFTSGGSGVSGLTATPSVTPEGVVYYDGPSATTWSETSTGAFGVVWIPGLSAGSVSLTIGGSHTATLAAVPIYADTVTFVLAEI